jgi:hypothetical protein
MAVLREGGGGDSEEGQAGQAQCELKVRIKLPRKEKKEEDGSTVENGEGRQKDGAALVEPLGWDKSEIEGMVECLTQWSDLNDEEGGC